MSQQIKSIFGASIRRARAENDLTQHGLAQRMGVDPQYVSRWERGTVLPSATNILLLAENLERSVAWFYTDHESEATEEAAA